MPPLELWISLLWSLAGALLGQTFIPVAERLSTARQHHGVALTAAVVTPVAQRPAVRPGIAGHGATSVLVTATLFGVLAWRLGVSVESLAFSVLALFGVRLAMIDLAELRLPTPLVLPLYPATMGLLSLAAMIDDKYVDLLRAVIGMIGLSVAYLAIALLSRGGIGAGDIRLAGPVGLLLAWQSWTAVITGTMLAFVYATIATVTTIARGRATRHTQVPFGPAMLGGMFTVVLISWPP